MEEARTSNWNIPKVFSSYALNDHIRIDSTSGGLFSVLAEHFLIQVAMWQELCMTKSLA